MRSPLHRILACWLLIHAGFTVQVLILRETMLLEWSIVLMMPYIILVLIATRKSASRNLKRLTWSTLALILLLYNFAVMYGMVVGAEGSANVPRASFDMRKLVPVDNVLYMTLMCLAILLSVVLAVLISKCSFAKTDASPESDNA